jgi:hypothetical protein
METSSRRIGASGFVNGAKASEKGLGLGLGGIGGFLDPGRVGSGLRNGLDSDPSTDCEADKELSSEEAWGGRTRPFE